MDEQSKLVPRERSNGGSIDPLSSPSPVVTLDMMPREAHLLDYLMVLRKHQWLIGSFLLAVVTLVTISTFREQPVYDATTRIEIDRENNSILPFNGPDGSFSVDEDLGNYIQTQSKILTSQTLALETIKSLNLDTDPRFGGNAAGSTATQTTIRSTVAGQTAPRALQSFLLRSGGKAAFRQPPARCGRVSTTNSNLVVPKP